MPATPLLISLPLLALFVATAPERPIPSSLGKPAKSSYRQDIPNTALHLEMTYIPAAMDADGKPAGDLWISQMEIPWELYDVFV